VSGIRHVYYGYNIDTQIVDEQARKRMADGRWGWSTIVHHHARDTSCNTYQHDFYDHETKRVETLISELQLFEVDPYWAESRRHSDIKTEPCMSDKWYPDTQALDDFLQPDLDNSSESTEYTEIDLETGDPK
jgi:hypothetical protein